MSVIAQLLKGVQMQPQGQVRPLQETDIPQVAALHDRMTGRKPGKDARSTEQHFMQIFLRHPWLDASLPSLVYQASDGSIEGCIGVMPRKLMFDGNEITAVVTHNFMVAPGARSSMAALQLARHVLAGSQDLSLAEGNNNSRRIWESFDGSASLLYSLHWTRPLHAGRYLLGFLQKRGLPAPLCMLLRPLSRLADALLPRLFATQFGKPPADCSGEELDLATLVNCLRDLDEDRRLRPLPDEHSLRWLLQSLQSRRGQRLHKIVVRNAAQEILGWYLYYGAAGATGMVVQVAATSERCQAVVLQHLFHHARQQGVHALSGQLDPVLFSALATQHCIFHNDGTSWLLVHSRRPQILDAINAGKAFLSRLEGEWWINYING